MDFMELMSIKMLLISAIGVLLIIGDKLFQNIKARTRCYIWFILVIGMLIPAGLVDIKVSEDSIFAGFAVEVAEADYDNGGYEADMAENTSALESTVMPNTAVMGNTATENADKGKTPDEAVTLETSKAGVSDTMQAEVSESIANPNIIPPVQSEDVFNGTQSEHDLDIDIQMNISHAMEIIWIMGVAGFLVINCIGYIKISSKCKNGIQKEAAGINYLVCKEINTPFTIGILKKRIILPQKEYSEEYLAMILKHEMIHIKHHDTDGKMLMLLANSLLWFNPVVWVMRKRYNRDIELACDEKIVKAMKQDERISYGELLYNEAKGNRDYAYGTFFSAKGELPTRIKNVVNATTKKKGYILLAVIAIISLIFLLSFTIKKVDLPFINEQEDVVVVTTEQETETETEAEPAFFVVNQLNGLQFEYDQALQQDILELLNQAQVSEPEFIENIERNYYNKWNAHMISVAQEDGRTEYYIAEGYNCFYVKRYADSGVVTEKHADVDITYIDKLYELIYWVDRRVGSFNYENYVGYLDECYYYYDFKDFVNKDYDCDGLVDRVYRNEDISYRIEFGNGDVLEIVRNLWPGTILELHSADLNGDGKQEIIFVNDNDSYMSNNPYPTVDLVVYEKEGDSYKEMDLPFIGGDTTSVKVAINYEYQGDTTYKIYVENYEEPFSSTMTGQNWKNGEYLYMNDLNLPTHYQGLADVYVKRDEDGDKLVVVHRAFSKGSGALIELTLGYDNGLVIEDGMLWEDGAHLHYTMYINLIEGYETGQGARENGYSYVYINDINTTIESFKHYLGEGVEYSTIKTADSLSEWKLDDYEGTLISFEECDGVGRSVYEYTYNDRTGYYVIYGMDGKDYVYKIIFPLNVDKEQMEEFISNIRIYSGAFDFS